MIKLAIDIGNTNICLGWGKNSPMRVSKIKTKSVNNLTQIKKFLKAKFKTFKPEVISICSVVPSKTSLIEEGCREVFRESKVIVVGRDLNVPIKNLYQKPKEVGQDRLINAFYLKEKFGFPGICVDLGTALTFDLISEKGEYEGGLIFPGVRLSLQALQEGAELLPLTDLRKLKNIYGNNTKESIRAGIIIGFSSLIDGVIKKLKKIFKKKPYVVGTGGDIKYFKPYIKEIKFWHPLITLAGIFEFMRYYSNFYEK